jgi:DNA-binding PadR family transcriptional regulator
MSDRPSNLSHLGGALLGLLARKERTGYELARAMQQPIGYFWTAGHTQIYPELARLESIGLVRHRDIPGRGPRQTKSYRCTGAGMRALRAWVAADLDPQPIRDLETLRLWSVWTVTPQVAVDLVRRCRGHHVRVLDAYLTEIAKVPAVGHGRDRSHPEFASRLTLEGGIRRRRAAVEWCDWMLGELTTTAEPGKETP